MNAQQNKENCVMIVEDSIDLQMLIGEFLESEGFKVEFAGNGKEALDHLEHKQSLPSMILLDIMMPVMDGIQFRQEQIKNPKISNIPVVVMSADIGVKNRLSSLHIKDYFSKPLDMDQLLSKVQNLC